MRKLLLVSLVALASCAASDSKDSTRVEVSSSSAQAVVDRFAQQYPEIARLSIHEPKGGDWRIVASTVKGRVGEASDPEDLQAAKSGEPIYLQEGHNLDLTLPVKDEGGKTTAIVGLTLSGVAGDRNSLQQRAQELGGQIAGEIRGKK